MKFLSVFLLLIACHCQVSHAAIKTWVAPAGASPAGWGNANNWSPAGVPVSGDRVIFVPGYQQSILLDMTLPILQRMTVRDGVRLSLLASGGYRFLRFNTTDTALIVEGSQAGLFATPTASLSLGGQFQTNYGVALSYIGAGNTAVIRGALSVMNNSSYTSTFANTQVYGYVDHQSAQAPINSNASNFRFKNGSIFSTNAVLAPIPVATWEPNSTCVIWGSTGAWDPQGFSQAFGNVYLHMSGSINFNSYLTTVQGNLTVDFAVNALDLNFADASNCTLNIGGDFIVDDQLGQFWTQPLYRLQFAKGAGNLTMNIGGRFEKRLGYSTQIDLGSAAGTTIINVKKDFINLGAKIRRSNWGSASVNFTGTDPQFFRVDTSDRIDYRSMPGSRVILDPPSNYFTINTSPGPASGSFTVGPDSRMVLGTKRIRGGSDGTTLSSHFAVSDNATVDVGDPNGFLGNIQTYTSSIGSLGRVTFTASSAQITNLPPGDIGRLSSTNIYGLTLSAPLSLNAILQLNGGCRLFTDATKILTLKSTASVINSGGYVIGPMQRVGAPLEFPVGSIGTAITPFTITGTMAATDTFRVEHINASAAAVGPIGTNSGLQSVSTCSYWQVSYRGPAMPAVNLSGWWNPNTYACANILSTPVGVALGRYGRSSWDASSSSGGVSGTQLAGSVTWNSVTRLGLFTVGRKKLQTLPNGTFKGIQTGGFIDTTATANTAARVWPNPSSGLINLSVNAQDAKTGAVTATIVDAAGRVVQQLRMNGRTSVEIRKSGVYVISFRNVTGELISQQRVSIVR